MSAPHFNEPVQGNSNITFVTLARMADVFDLVAAELVAMVATKQERPSFSDSASQSLVMRCERRAGR